MFESFMHGFFDELEKQAGLRTSLKKALVKAKQGLDKAKSSVKDFHRDKIEQSTGTWDEDVPKFRREGGAFLKGKKGVLPEVGRRVLHEARKHLHTRKVSPEDLDPKSKQMADAAGIRLEEGGPHQHPAIRKIRKFTASRYEQPELGSMRAHIGLKPHKGRVVIGGRAKDAPEIVKHELGHATGIGKEHGFKLGLATRSLGPQAAKILAAHGKGRAAKVVQGLSDAGTFAEEVRAWKRSGVGGEALAKARRGDIGGAVKKLADPAIGLGSYALNAKNQQKSIGDIASKALAAKAAKAAKRV